MLDEETLITIIQGYHSDATCLIQILRELQTRCGFIPADALHLIATQLKLPVTQVIAVIEFYSFLSLSPQGRYRILFSDSITDRMLHKQALMDELCAKLGVKAGELRQDGMVSIGNTSCTGLCDQGPAILINGLAIPRLNSVKIDQIVLLINAQKPLSEWPESLFTIADNIYYSDLLLTETIKPGNALQALLTHGPDEILQEIDRSGLCGRGGAGFNTANKWRFCRAASAEMRYVVCNADEGEPGTFKDRVLLNSYLGSVIEGMTICARIIGAKHGFIYLRGEYLYLMDKLHQVLQSRREQHLLGNDILSVKGFDFNIDIHLGAGAYICGEESALLEALEGKRGIPRNRPPYPVTHGYLGQPTVVNNVETFAAAAKITLLGGDWFNAVGTEKSKGTKILSISGDCRHPGIYEYPFGTTIQQILQDCYAQNTKAVQVGGPSGTLISASEFDRVVAFEDLATGGAFMIFDETRDIIDIVSNFSHFFAHESCGFCTPCRVGTSLLTHFLDKIQNAQGTVGDMLELDQVSQLVKQNSHCGLGHTAANPIIDSMQRFPEVYHEKLQALNFSPGFDLDAALQESRKLTDRNDPNAHLQQV